MPVIRKNILGGTFMIVGATAVYGIIGNPVSHSMSPLMHNAAFESLGIDAVYVPFRVEDVESAVQGLRGLNICGVSVTIPHKEAVIPLLDEVDPVAGKIGAVNTIVSSMRDGRPFLKGFNTDWIGANRALQAVVSLKGKQVLLLGAGGSARAIGFGLLEAGAEVILCSRTPSRGRQLADEFGCLWLSLEDIGSVRADIVVNATSVGMAPQEDVSLMTVEQLSGVEAVMDIVYSPHRTRLLANADKAGCAIVSGLEMLLYQGVQQFELWQGREAPLAVMRHTLYRLLGYDAVLKEKEI
ncbi:probable shikimate 5-dehydrogenase [Desulfotalea psychrophila LSv54]|uniref:Shikimate dehydrogenase (NADP(+)) n=2 Tax=Desulfotalea psychrophila TaxID=84980 RepID=Q6AIT9_DESPS|nr:probable shikimate 5-dehydrogenase [Desulfotalea psychrophila LSv54]